MVLDMKPKPTYVFSCRAILTRRSRRRIKHRNVDVRDAHRPLGSMTTLTLTFVTKLTFTGSPAVLGAGAACCAAPERLAGNHISGFAVCLL